MLLLVDAPLVDCVPVAAAVVVVLAGAIEAAALPFEVTIEVFGVVVAACGG